jgi:3,4-dihydroxy 2-butanone 4-phosphate synthase/GTP cyclohydrolase II
MARRPDLEVFAQEHGLKMGTIADLIHYRLRNEKTVERVTECTLPTEFGDFRLLAYQDMIAKELHLALVRGDVRPEQPTLVRVHMQNSLCDLLGTSHAGCGWPLKNAMRQVAEAEEGVIVVLRNHDTAREIAQRIGNIQLRDAGQSVSKPKQESGTVLLTYGVGAQILMDLGVQKMRVLSAPKSLHGLSGFDLEVVEYVDCI